MDEIKYELDKIKKSISGVSFWLMIIALILCGYLIFSVIVIKDIKDGDFQESKKLMIQKYNRY